MKRLSKFIGLIAIAIMAFSCKNEKITQLESQVNTFQSVIDKKDVLLNDMTTCLDVLAFGLDSIYQQQNIIYSGRNEVTGKKLTATELKSRITDLGKLIARQQEKIEELEKSLASKNNKQIESLKLLIANMQQQLSEKEKEIEELKNLVVKQRQDITMLQKAKEELEHHVSNQGNALKIQDEIINEGYYIIGTRKELKEAGIITSNLIQKSKVDLGSVDLSKLKKIDIRNFSTELKINAKKAVVLSHMPESSYKIVQGGGRTILYIEDVAQFWSMSKILVIQTK